VLSWALDVALTQKRLILSPQIWLSCPVGLWLLILQVQLGGTQVVARPNQGEAGKEVTLLANHVQVTFNDWLLHSI
jgi:hypothetical protein